MSWVRYDDGFYTHPKVLAIIHEDPGAIALHVLANTWTNKQKRVGFIPATVPAVLLADRKRASKWAALLEKHGLWDAADGGWEIHDASDYRESAKRSTPGTPAEVSAKRRIAGSKGGKTTQQRKQTGEQVVQQNQANGAANKQLAGSPVVKASNEALTPVPVPTTSGEAGPNGGLLIAEYIRGCNRRPPDSIVGQLAKHVGQLLEQGFDPAHIREGLTRFRAKGDVHPSTLPSFVNGVANAPVPVAASRSDVDRKYG